MRIHYLSYRAFRKHLKALIFLYAFLSSMVAFSASSVNVELESLSGQSTFSPFSIQSDSGASNNQYIVWPNNGNNQIVSTPSDSESGQVEITFTLSQSANVTFDILANMPNGSDDSFYYKLDSGSWTTQNNQSTSGWGNLNLTTFSNLSSGSHTLYILRREDGAQLDRVTLTASSGDISAGSGGSGGTCDLPFSNNGISITQQTTNWSTPVIDISCAPSVDLSMLASGIGPMESSDYLNIYYRLDGGAQVALSQDTNSFAQKAVSANNLSGDTLEIIVNGQTSQTDETYTVSNINVSSNGSGSLPSGISSQDIGNVGLTGSASYDSGSGEIRVSASGSEIEGTDDSFHFVYADLSGDGQVTFKLHSISANNPWAKAGVMIRESLDSDARNAALLLTAQSGSRFQHRTTSDTQESWDTDDSDGLNDEDVRWLLPEKWLRMTREGTTLTAWSSQDGECWVQRRSESISGMGNVQAGFALSALDNNSLASATISEFSVESNVEPHNESCTRGEYDGILDPMADISNLNQDNLTTSEFSNFYDIFYDGLIEKGLPGGAMALLKDGTLVASSAVGFRSKKLDEDISRSDIFRLASVDKMVTKQIIVNLIDDNELSIDTNVLQFLNGSLNLNLQPYPGESGFNTNASAITIRHLLYHRSYISNGDDSLIGMERAYFDYGITSDQWEPAHLIRLLFSDETMVDRPDDGISGPVATPPGWTPASNPDFEAYSSNGYFVLRYVADQIIKAGAYPGSNNLEEYMNNVMNLDFVVIHDRYTDRDPNEVGHFEPMPITNIVDRNMWLEDYYALGSSADTLASYFINNHNHHIWHDGSMEFVTQGGGTPGHTNGGWANATQYWWDPDNAVAVLINTSGTTHDDIVADLTHLYFELPDCGWGSAQALTPASDSSTPYFIRNVADVTYYMSSDNSGDLSIPYNFNTQANSHWTLHTEGAEGNFVRLMNNGLNIHTENQVGGSSVLTMDNSTTNPNFTTGWYSAHWEFEAISGTPYHRIRNRYQSDEFLMIDSSGNLVSQPTSGTDREHWAVCNITVTHTP